MGSWVLAHPPWHALARVRLRWDVFVRAGTWNSRQFLNTPPLTADTPAMQQIRAYPYPETAPDNSLFEDISNDYQAATQETEAHTGSYPLHVEVDHPSSLLRNLVMEEKYQDANRVYTELLDMGAEIPPHPAYHFAAREVLYDTKLAPADRLEAFVKWWSLVPSRGETGCYREVRGALTHLLRGLPAPDIPLIVRFGLLAASKGYVFQVAGKVIPTVARYAPTQVTLRFLEELCTAAWDFESSLATTNRSPSETRETQALLTRSSEWYCLGIKELAFVQRTGAALEVLQLARSRDIEVSLDTYDILLNKLSSEPNRDGIAIVMSLRKTQLGHPAWLEIPDEDLEQPAPTPASTHQPGDTHNSASVTSRDNLVSLELSTSMQSLVATARFLKHSLHAGKLPITSATIATVISIYLKTGRGSLLRRLRERTYQHEHLIPRWALAELEYHHARGHSLATIMKVFESHFHLVGVPQGILDSLWEERGRGRSTGVAQFRPGLHRKLPPSAHHTFFIWDVFLRRARTRTQVGNLYKQFLENVAASRDVSPSRVPYLASLADQESGAEQEEYLRAIPPPSLFHAGHFALFMNAFTRCGFRTLAARMVVDMYALGIKPDARLSKAFVGSLGYIKPTQPFIPVIGFFGKALRAVDEGASTATATDPHSDADSSPPSSMRTRAADMLKAETMTFIYAGVIKRLLCDERTAEAVKLASYLVRRELYQPGTSVVVDKVLNTPVIVSA
ncbi:hypothetical protein C2E23DRAFT_498950 [Lenzites betulinus]|nr:hypothetical protein C2E23DRAFT_498950 [Lenzites betulinus]